MFQVCLSGLGIINTDFLAVTLFFFQYSFAEDFILFENEQNNVGIHKLGNKCGRYALLLSSSCIFYKQLFGLGKKVQHHCHANLELDLRKVKVFEKWQMFS